MKIVIEVQDTTPTREPTTVWHLLGNLINLPLGIAETLAWVGFGVVWCITIVGIPFGMQCFKMAQLAIWPFGRTVVTKMEGHVSLVLNIVWIVFTGLALAIGYVLEGVVLCITLIGIPWGLQKFKMAKLVLLPFGAKLV